MKTIKIVTLIILIILSNNAFSQISGNQIYNNNSRRNYNNRNYSVQNKSVRTTDSTLTISSNILINEIPDLYKITLGINQESKTVKECNDLINKRIVRLKKSLVNIGILDSDIYVDFISQTKVYDYRTDDTKAIQYLKGFDIKKNMIITIKNINLVDKIIEYSAIENIHDIIKVNYINTNIESIYKKLYLESIRIIENKKKLYVSTFHPILKPKSRILFDNFRSIFPNTQYQKYTAFSTSSINIYNNKRYNRYTKRDVPKSTTYYYEGANVGAYDKVLNNTSPYIGIQYSLNISVVFDIVK